MSQNTIDLSKTEQVPAQTHSTLWISPAWQGALWKLVSFGAFAGINAIVRYLGGGGSLAPEVTLSSSMMQFFQNFFGVLFLLPWIFKNSSQPIFIQLKTSYPFRHFFRVLAAVLGIALWYLTLRHMPISEGVALSFTGPVFTVLGAALFLGEKLPPRKCFAIILSLFGAFIISRPDLALAGNDKVLGWVVLLPLSSALILAWNKLLTRQLTNYGESPEKLTLYLLLLMAPVSLIPALFDWVTPSLGHWPWLIALGALAAIAHYTFSKAYKLAEVTFLMPFGFSKFFFNMLLGLCIFSEIPKPSLWFGLCIIGSSILFLAKAQTYKQFFKRLKLSNRFASQS